MKRFNMVDESFICENCGNLVLPLEYSARDHCPVCLFSKHVDINPGDRANSCLGLLKPVDVEKFNNTYKIVYTCLKCGKNHKNIMAKDDNFDSVILLSIQK